MKRYFKRCITLMLVMMLILSLTGVAEDSIIADAVEEYVIEDIEEDLIIDNPEGDSFDLSLNDTEELSGEDVTQGNLSEASMEESAFEGEVSTVIPSSIRIGVKERYAIDTSGLSGKITFKSKNKKIATVSKNGVIRGKKVGKTKITVKPKGGKKTTITVTVAKAPKKVYLSNDNISLMVGEQFALGVSLPKKTASYNMAWTSSDMGVAVVDGNGVVTAIASGSRRCSRFSVSGRTATHK